MSATACMPLGSLPTRPRSTSLLASALPTTLTHLASVLASIATTLLLFVKSDLKSIVLPVILYGAAATRCFSLGPWIASVHWTLIHLLQFCISNQTLDHSVEEDAINKPWRPIPAGRISVRVAVHLRQALTVWCLLASAYNDNLVASVVILVTTYLYNDLGCHQHWALKNCTNVIGYIAFHAGASGILGGSDQSLSHILSGAITLGSIVLTTIHASDFPDVTGDRELGRSTLPIVYPRLSRWGIYIALLLWSWQVYAASPQVAGSEAYLVLGVFVASKFVACPTEKADKTSGALYYLWLAGSHLLVGASL